MNEFKSYTDIDFKILDFIIKNSPVHKDKILKKFSDESFTAILRVKTLKENNLILESFYIKNTDIGDEKVFTENFSITEKGIKLFSDLNLKRKKEKREKFIFHVLPILISLISLLKSFEKEIIFLKQLLMTLLK